jgi:predicted PurR-regulated permease PerM
MPFPDRRTASVLLTILLFAAVLAIAYIARSVLLVFCFSILFAYLIDPVVRFLQRHSLFLRHLRGPHITEAYFAVLVVLALIVYTLLPAWPGRLGALVGEIPTLTDRLATGEIATDLGHQYEWSDAETLRVKTFLAEHRSTIQNAMEALGQFTTGVLAAGALIPILAIFFLKDGQGLAEQVMRLMATNGDYDTLHSLAGEVNVTLQRYIRAKVILGALTFVYTSTTLLISGFPHPVALGLLAGALEFIPMAGWMTAAATIITIGVMTHAHWIWMAALLGVWRVLIDYWIAPRVLGHELEIHPLLTIFTLMVGAAVGGLAGAYLALPIAAVVRVVWRRLAASPAAETGMSPLSPASSP